MPTLTRASLTLLTPRGHNPLSHWTQSSRDKGSEVHWVLVGNKLRPCAASVQSHYYTEVLGVKFNVTVFKATELLDLVHLNDKCQRTTNICKDLGNVKCTIVIQ